jgi:hypothetical protein
LLAGLASLLALVAIVLVHRLSPLAMHRACAPGIVFPTARCRSSFHAPPRGRPA